MDDARFASSALTAPGESAQAPAANSPSYRRFLTLSLVLGSITFALWVYLLQSRHFYQCDPAIYMGQARMLLAGHALYDQIATDKPPLSLLAHVCCALVLPASFAAQSVALVLVICIQIASLLAFLRPSTSALLAAGAALLSIPLTHLDFSWLSTEHVSNIWITALLILAVLVQRADRVIPWHSYLCGILTVLAWQTRPNALLAGIVPMAVILMRSPGMRAAALSLFRTFCGGMLAWGLVLVLVYAIGNVPRYLFINFLYPFVYASASYEDGRYSLIFEHGLVAHSQLFILLALAAGATFFTSARWLAILIAVTGFLTCITSARPYDHYWMNLLPFVAVLIMLAADSPPRVRWFRHLQSPRLAIVFAIILLTYVPQALAVTRDACQKANRVKMDEIVAQLNDLAPPGTTMSVIGPVRVEYLVAASHMIPPHPIWSMWFLERTQEITRIYASPDVIVREYQAAQPGIFVVDRLWIQQRQAYVLTHPHDEAQPIVDLVRWVTDSGEYTHLQSLTRFEIYRHRRFDPAPSTDASPPGADADLGASLRQ